ncbi:G protein-coupled receptor family protein [Kineosporia babensis]|uniref:Uncharacterized protein n=1 Tax=Kineosporia babensis TaxID=499548 RepID=A0A9X1SXK0_9ACTN|nr:hypothetical protein [Kineosporia babensis]MCD5315909.1 hypothetical protein [Kineosporia babensis]
MFRVQLSPDERREQHMLRGTGLAMVLGWGVLTLAMLVWGGSQGYLAFVDPVVLPFDTGGEVSAAAVSGSPLGIALHAVVIFAAVVLCAGLPVERAQSRAV